MAGLLDSNESDIYIRARLRKRGRSAFWVCVVRTEESMIRGKFMGFVAIGLGLLSGCSGEPAGSEGSDSPVAGDVSIDVETATETELNVVHSLSFSDTHRVDFIHYGQGMVGLRESFHMDSDKGTTIFGD